MDSNIRGQSPGCEEELSHGFLDFNVSKSIDRKIENGEGEQKRNDK